MTRIFYRLFLWKWIPCQAVESVLCLLFRPNPVHCSTKKAYNSKITFLELYPCIFWWDLVKTVLFSFQLSSNNCELNRKRSSNLIGTVLWPCVSSCFAFTHKHDTGCPNKHENSVTNSISFSPYSSLLKEVMIENM